HGPTACFEHLDRPDAPPKLVELRLQSARQLQPVVRLNETHDFLRECRNGPEWLLYLYHKRIKPDQYISAPPRKSPSTERSFRQEWDDSTAGYAEPTSVDREGQPASAECRRDWRVPPAGRASRGRSPAALPGVPRAQCARLRLPARGRTFPASRP